MIGNYILAALNVFAYHSHCVALCCTVYAHVRCRWWVHELIMLKLLDWKYHPIPQSVVRCVFYYRGPDIPCFLKIEKWIMTKIRVRSGKTNVWMLYNLVKVDWLTLKPPLIKTTDILPIPRIKLSNASGTDGHNFTCPITNLVPR
jgi:hypothetical protein